MYTYSVYFSEDAFPSTVYRCGSAREARARMRLYALHTGQKIVKVERW